MKKLIYVLLLFISGIIYSQETVFIKNYAGIDIYVTYELVREKEGKKEYKFYAHWINNTGKELFYKAGNRFDYFATVQTKGLGSHTFRLNGEKATKKVGKSKVFVIYPGKKYEDVYYTKWFNANEVPEFEVKINSEYTIENDFSRYN